MNAAKHVKRGILKRALRYIKVLIGTLHIEFLPLKPCDLRGIQRRYDRYLRVLIGKKKNGKEMIKKTKKETRRKQKKRKTK